MNGQFVVRWGQLFAKDVVSGKESCHVVLSHTRKSDKHEVIAALDVLTDIVRI